MNILLRIPRLEELDAADDDLDKLGPGPDPDPDPPAPNLIGVGESNGTPS